MSHVRLHAVDGQNHLTLLFEPFQQTFLIRQVERHQLFVAFQQIRHGALGDAYSALDQALMDLRDTAVLSVAQLTDHGDDIQAKLPMRQRPGSFFFRSIGHMVQRTLRGAAAPHHQGKVHQSPERHEGAPGMVGHPQPLSTTHALLTQRRQAHFSLGGGTSFSSGHLLDPPLGNYSATLLRKRVRLSLSVERTSSTVWGATRPVSPIQVKNFLNEAR